MSKTTPRIVGGGWGRFGVVFGAVDVVAAALFVINLFEQPATPPLPVIAVEGAVRFAAETCSASRAAAWRERRCRRAAREGRRGMQKGGFDHNLFFLFL